MFDSAIRQLAAGWNTTRICAGFVESTIQIWDTASREQLSEFHGQFEFGAKNLALHPDGTQIVAGVSKRKGIVEAYQAPAGRRLWDRSELYFPARLRFSPSGKHVYCTLNDRNVEKFDIETGQTVAIIQGACHIFEGVYGKSLTAAKSDRVYRVHAGNESSQNDFVVPQLTFALLDTAFSPDGIFLAEASGPVRHIDGNTGHELWRFEPPGGSHVLNLYWSANSGSVYGVLWHFEKGKFRCLVRFDTKNGRSHHVCDLHSWEEVFVAASDELISSTGEIVELSTGRVVGKLPFPQTEYPDR